MIFKIFKFLKRVFVILKESEKPDLKKVYKFFLIVLYLSLLFGLIGFFFYFFLTFIS
jgi:preprotein translocase subunit Sss1